MKRIQYTIRNIPPNIDRVVRKRAQQQGKSLNATLVETLKKGAGVSNKPTEYRNLGWFFSSGGIGKKEESAFKAQRTIDWKAWR